MGTPAFAAAVLKKLLDENLPPLAVVCQPARAAGRGLKYQACEVETLARAHGLPVFPTENANSPELLASLQPYKPDLLLVAAFGQILKRDLLQLPKLFSLNVHASLLPQYRGAAPIQRAIWNGDVVTGITIQKMVKKLDAGDILLKEPTAIGPEETSGELFIRLSELGGECLVRAIRLIEGGHYLFSPQDESQATFAPKIQKEEAVLNWNEPAKTLHCKIRALQPWPVAETQLGGTRLKIFRAAITPGGGGGFPGKLETDHKTSLTVHCGQGTALSLTQIQLENRKKLEIRDFLMAYRGNFPFSTFE